MQRHAHRSALIPLYLGVALCACGEQPAKPGGGAPAATAAQSVTATTTATAPPPKSAQVSCNGTFSDGSSISVKRPVWLTDVPGEQSFCDFHTFAWNQFLYLVQDQGGQPRFLSMAPWYNLFVPPGKAPTDYPGGSTALQIHQLSKAQAGDSYSLVDVTGATVLFDIRVNEPMFRDVQKRSLYNAAGFDAACQGASGTCAREIWMPPNDASADDALEIKTAWRDFRSSACPPSMYCVGHWGLAGMHLVQKSKTHGEWVWASFEHVDNSPDCQPGGSNPIAAKGPGGQPWAFFDPKTVPASVMSSGACDVKASPPQCNGDPRTNAPCGGAGQPACTFKPVNICRTDQLPAGGASAENCKVVSAPHLPNDQANNAGNVACLNATIDPQLPGPWKNYVLVGSVWVRGGVGPTQDFRVEIFQPAADAGAPSKEPVGFVHMANTTMETWMQNGSTGFDPVGVNAKQAGCFLCHNLPSAPTTAPFPQGDLSHTFAKIKNGSKAKLIEAK